MSLFINFGILFVFVLWLQYEIRKNTRLSKKGIDEFWKQEASANKTRKMDITNLDYISIPISKLPMADTNDSTINSYRDTILSLSHKEIVNLTGITNTELKLQYGASNIALLMAFDNNYTLLVSILHKWGERLYKNGDIKEAITVLEYGIQCNTDARITYRLLSQIYKEIGISDKIDDLLQILSNSKINQVDLLIKELNAIKIS